MRYRFLRFPGGLYKAVTLSYDDGCRDDIRFSETICAHGLKCTFNINSGFIAEKEGDWHLTREQIKKYLIDTGNEIAVHGKYHRALGKVTPVDGIRDVLECRTELENDFGMIIRGMAYPDSGITRFENGADYSDIKHYLKDLGIVYSRTLGGDNDSFALPTDWHAWMPTAHHTNPELFSYIDKFLNEPMPPYNASQTPGLFYLWGHSFEFENNKNWDLLDRICKELSGKPDIWYATNIEIYDYVSAYDSLIFSADCSRVYNPSLITVWFSADDKLYSVKSGETLIIK